MIIDANHFTPLVETFSRYPTNSHTISLHLNDAQYVIDVRINRIWHLLWRSPVDTTLECLQLLIGNKRFERIVERKELEFLPNQFQKKSFKLSLEVAKKIFLGLGDIRWDDLEEAALGYGRELRSYSVPEIDQLYRSLIPFEKIEDVFFRTPPEIDYYDMIETCGKGYKGLLERVATILSLWKTCVEEELDSLRQFMTEVEVLTSRLGDREPPEGTVIRLRKGYYVIDKVFAAGGCYVSVLRNMTDCKAPILLCRGTAVRLKATGCLLSCFNDLLPDIGMLGIKSIWQDVADYLHIHRIEEIDIFGKSLGGAHAQYLTTLVTGKTKTRVATLVTCCSVGVNDQVSEIFHESLKNRQKEEPDICIIRNSGNDGKEEVDYIPFIGGTHVHTKSERTKIYYLFPSTTSDELVDGIPTDGWMLQKVYKFMTSFLKAHIRQTTLKEYNVKIVPHTQKEVKKGLELEWIRELMAKTLNRVYGRLLDVPSFEYFYQSFQSKTRNLPE